MKRPSIYSIAALLGALLVCTQAGAADSQGMTLLKENFPIADSFLQQWMPRAAYNDIENNFMVLWHTDGIRAEGAPLTYSLDGQLLSPDGTFIGDPFLVLDVVDDMTKTLPMPSYNIFKNEYMVAYTWKQPTTKQDPFLTILDPTGAVIKNAMDISPDPTNVSHPYIIFNSKRHEYLILFNDSRYGVQDAFGVIVDEQGTIVKSDFQLNTLKCLKFNPNGCYNPVDDTYLVNWEDFRHVKTWQENSEIYGSLIDAEGNILADDIPLVDDWGKPDEGEQRHNITVYNPDKNEFFTAWTDARPSLTNVGVIGQFVSAEGKLVGSNFTVADGPGAQIAPHAVYLPERKQYFVIWDDGRNDDPNVSWRLETNRDTYAQWMSDTGETVGEYIPITIAPGVQRYSEIAYSPLMDRFLIVWRDEVKELEGGGYDGHAAETGGNIMGAVYGSPSFMCTRVVEKGAGTGIEGAKVMVLGMPYMKNETTNIGGWFNIKSDGQKSGKYFLFARKQGYKSAFKSVDYAGDGLEVTIELEKR